MSKPKTTVIDDKRDLSYKEFTIRKKNGKERKIVSPSKDLKRYQKISTHKLNYFFKRYARGNGVWDNFHGFIPRRNAVTGAQKHIGYDVTLQMDFSDFFDNIKMDSFDDMIFEQLDIEKKLLFHKNKYTAQGFPSSPALCNIAIVEFVKILKENIDTLMNIGKENEDWVLTIYADDITISYNTDADFDEKWKEIARLVEEIAEEYGLLINKSKTRVRFAKYGWRKILGVNVGDSSVRGTRKTMRRIKEEWHNYNKKDDAHARFVAQGLTTWSRCYLPRNVQ